MEDKLLKLELPNDIGLEVRVFYDEDEVKYKFSYTYREYKEPGNENSDVIFHNAITMWGTYSNAILKKFHVLMNMTHVELRGKKFIYGVDVSPNSKLMLELEYETRILPLHELITMSPMEPARIKAEKVDPFSVWGGFRMTQCFVNNRPMLDDTLKGSLVQQIELPFEVKDTVLNDPWHGYQIPIPHMSNKKVNFEFPNSIKA